MWVSFIQSIEGLNSNDWGFLKKKEFSKLQHRNLTWVSSLLFYGIQTQDCHISMDFQPVSLFCRFQVSSLHNNMSQFLKINLSLSLLYTHILTYILSYICMYYVCIYVYTNISYINIHYIYTHTSCMYR